MERVEPPQPQTTIILKSENPRRWLFEVGEKGKSFDQIKDLPDSYLAVDDIETSRGNRVPLWLFGFLYRPVCGHAEAVPGTTVNR